MAIFNFEMLQCCVITGTGCHRGHHISGLTGCCAIVYMGAAILEQQEQLDYKESFPTTNDGALLADLKRGIRRWCEPDISTG